MPRPSHQILASAAALLLALLPAGPASSRVPRSPLRVVVLDPSQVLAAPDRGRAGLLRFGGRETVRRGQIVAVSIGRATPLGFLGRAVKVTKLGDQTIVATKPASLRDALPSGVLRAALDAGSNRSDGGGARAQRLACGSRANVDV